MNSTPPANQPRSRAACAAWTASAVFPTRARPATAETTTVAARPDGSSSPVIVASSPARPVNPVTPGGSCASATGATAWNVTSPPACTTVPQKVPWLIVLPRSSPLSRSRAMARPNRVTRNRRHNRGRADGKTWPVRFWSPAGPDEHVLGCLEQRRFAGLPRLVPTPENELAQLQVELDAAFAHLRDVDERYWDRDWRAAHKGMGPYPPHPPCPAGHGVPDPRGAPAPPPPPPAGRARPPGRAQPPAPGRPPLRA